MCGILAIFSPNRPESFIPNISQMTNLMRHRGPDDEGYAFFSLSGVSPKSYGGIDTPSIVFESRLPHQPMEKLSASPKHAVVALAHRRLSIIDLSPSGHQPLCDHEQRYWIVFNGEIYNYKEIRAELSSYGVRFLGDSDTEVVLRAYIHWGGACVDRFNGMWAIVIWDDYEKSFWISRDRFGVKPLVYAFIDDTLIVASEAKALLPVANIKPNCDEMLACLLDGPSESHEATLFRGVYRFPAAHSAFYKASSRKKELNFQRYWKLPDPELGMTFSTRLLDEYADRYRDLLSSSVRLRLRSDVKLSCSLSGGLDSSSIVYFAQQELGFDNSDLVTVSNIYTSPSLSYCDESQHIDHVVNLLKVESYRREPNPLHLLEKGEQGLWFYENVFNDVHLSAMTVFELCKDEGIKVNLDGQGADESLAGYSRYWQGYFSHRSRFDFDYWVSLARAPLDFPSRLRGLAKRYHSVRSPYEIIARIAHRFSIGSRIRRRTGIDGIEAGPVNQQLHSSIKMNLPNLLRNIDYISMSNSVESRQPFMDYHLVEFLNKIPASYKLHKGWTKYLARHAMQGRLPDEIVWRKDKMGWPQPSALWLKSQIWHEVEAEIRNSAFLEDLIGGWRPGDLEQLQRSPRLYLRFFNMARFHRIFFQERALRI